MRPTASHCVKASASATLGTEQRHNFWTGNTVVQDRQSKHVEREHGRRTVLFPTIAAHLSYYSYSGKRVGVH